MAPVEKKKLEETTQTSKSYNYANVNKQRMMRMSKLFERDIYEFARYPFANGIDLRNIDRNLLERCRDRYENMKAISERMKVLYEIETQPTSTQYMETELRGQVEQAVGLISHTGQEKMLKMNAKKVDAIFLKFREDIDKKLREVFHPKHASFAGNLEELVKQGANSQFLSQNDQETHLLKTKIASIKTKTFECWTTFSTYRLIIQGMDEIKDQRRKSVWKHVLCDPMQDLDWNVLDEATAGKLRFLCGCYSPSFVHKLGDLQKESSSKAVPKYQAEVVLLSDQQRANTKTPIVHFQSSLIPPSLNNPLLLSSLQSLMQAAPSPPKNPIFPFSSGFPMFFQNHFPNSQVLMTPSTLQLQQTPSISPASSFFSTPSPPSTPINTTVPSTSVSAINVLSPDDFKLRYFQLLLNDFFERNPNFVIQPPMTPQQR